MRVEVAVALESDIDDVLAVLDEAAAWLHSTGVTEQWPQSFSADPSLVDEIRRRVDDGRAFMTRKSGLPVGVFMLEPWREGVWPDDGGTALYLSKLAVRRAVAGHGVAQRMLDWACDHARAKGKEELRLDCWAGNNRLKRYYTEAGFESRGDCTGEARASDGRLRQYEVTRFARRVSR